VGLGDYPTGHSAPRTWTRRRLGALLADAGRTADARVAIERVLRADADHALALAVQGDLLEMDGLTLEAWRRWERAVALEPFGDGAARARRAMARAGT
jgi:hypothetical protein